MASPIELKYRLNMSTADASIQFQKAKTTTKKKENELLEWIGIT